MMYRINAALNVEGKSNACSKGDNSPFIIIYMASCMLTLASVSTCVK